MCVVRTAPRLRSLLTVFFGALALRGMSSCAGIDPSVVVESRSTGRMTLPLEGAYDVTASAPFGTLTARFTARATEDGFVASTRPGAAWGFVPGLGRLFGPVLAPSLFPDGVILSWWSRLPERGEPAEGWISVAGIRSLGLRTRMRSIHEPIELINREGKRVGIIQVTAREPDDPAASDFRGLAASVGQAVREHLYDGRLAQSGQVRAYARQLETVGSRARDDAEFVFGAFLAARNYPRLNTPIMWRRAAASEGSPFAEWDADERSTIRVEFDRATRIATLRVDAFLDAADVDRAMRRVMACAPRGLIIDLRNCPGVTLASLRLAAWLSDVPVQGPTLAGARSPGGAGAPPVVSLRSLEDYDRVDAALAACGLGRISIEPVGRGYGGPVAVLTSRRTSASAELIVRLLAETDRARVFGHPTAGRPIVSRPVEVGQGWTLWVASWDLITRSSRACSPDLVCSDAKQKATLWISSSN